MAKPKIITVELGQWGKAEHEVDKYLNRAGPEAWCEVHMTSAAGKVRAYRAGNPDAEFPWEIPTLRKKRGPRTAPAKTKAAKPKAAKEVPVAVTERVTQGTSSNPWSGDL